MLQTHVSSSCRQTVQTSQLLASCFAEPVMWVTAALSHSNSFHTLHCPPFSAHSHSSTHYHLQTPVFFLYPSLFLSSDQRRAAINRKGDRLRSGEPILVWPILAWRWKGRSIAKKELVKMKGHIKTVQVGSCHRETRGSMFRVCEDWGVSSSILKMSSSPSEPAFMSPLWKYT